MTVESNARPRPEADVDPVARLLAALPEFEPSPQLWRRIEAARPPAPRRRRWPLALAAGLVGAVAALVLNGLWRGSQPGGEALAGAERSPSQLVAQTLELEVASLRPGRAAAAGARAAEAELQRLDHALQAAYDRDAGREELDDLWRRRADILATLRAAYRHSDTVVRI